MFTSGRFEPHNKGFDLCLDALAQLNVAAQGRAQRHHGGVLHRHLAADALAQPARAREARRAQRAEPRLRPASWSGRRRALPRARPRARGCTSTIWSRSTGSCATADAGGLPHGAAAADRHAHPRRRSQTDPVLIQLRKLRAVQPAEDPVKIVYHPEFITPINPLWGIEYEQFVRGCHLGLFPERVRALGLHAARVHGARHPRDSSDLAGFGRYVRDDPGPRAVGPAVLSRRSRRFHEAAADLARAPRRLLPAPRRERVELRNKVERRSGSFDWSGSAAPTTRPTTSRSSG